MPASELNQDEVEMWQQHPVTKVFEQRVKERMVACVDQIIDSRDVTGYDVFLKGMIHAFKEILDEASLKELLDEQV